MTQELNTEQAAGSAAVQADLDTMTATRDLDLVTRGRPYG
jgi:hypothetical protein